MEKPAAIDDSRDAPEHRTRQGRFWLRLLTFSTVLLLALAILYDLFPSLILRSRVDQFMEIVKMGETREKVEDELGVNGFEVPDWPPGQQTATEIYQIRSREPFLSKFGDGIAQSLGYDDWWAEQKRPHFAIVTYDAADRIENIEFGSEFNPLWY